MEKQLPISNSLDIRYRGQTLIETIVAIFMLVTGIAAAVGLAVYAFGTSTNISNQIVASGLAREGIEAVKAMRDTNWLLQPSNGGIDANCFNYLDSTNSALCYKRWLGTNNGSPDPFFCLDPTKNSGNCRGDVNAGEPQNYLLAFDSTSAQFWMFSQQSAAGGRYGLRFEGSGSFKEKGYYHTQDHNGIACSNGANMSDFCRKIVITKLTDPPYDRDIGPMLKVQSQVWWVDKKCPRVSDWSLATSSCRVEMNIFLTNWKNY